jgi:hypothetical protein
MDSNLKNTIYHQTVDIVIANSLTLAVQITKNLVKKKGRMAPQFPIIIQPLPSPMPPYFQEYKDSNLWYASSGFVFATATAILHQ